MQDLKKRDSRGPRIKEDIMAQTTDSLNLAVQNLTKKTGKYLTFTLSGEDYGIGILKVKEIIGMMTITPVPRTPEYVKGVINLRGKVIPVVDLRLKFAMGEIEYNERTCIIVVEIDTDNETLPVGIVVDSVSEVLNIQEGEIEDPPAFGTRLDTGYIMGIAKTENGVKILLNIDKVLSTRDIAVLEQTA